MLDYKLECWNVHSNVTLWTRMLKCELEFWRRYNAIDFEICFISLKKLIFGRETIKCKLTCNPSSALRSAAYNNCGTWCPSSVTICQTLGFPLLLCILKAVEDFLTSLLAGWWWVTDTVTSHALGSLATLVWAVQWLLSRYRILNWARWRTRKWIFFPLKTAHHW